MDKVRELIASRMKERGTNAAEVSRKLGRNQAYMNQYLKRGIPHELPEEERFNLATVLDLDEVNLRGPKTAAAIAAKMSHRPVRHLQLVKGVSELDVSEVPEFEAYLGANYGGGYATEEDDTPDHQSMRAKWSVPLPFLRDALGIVPGRAHILPVRSDSMEPTLYDGDRVLVALDDRDIGQGGIFALRDDHGSLIIKQVELIREPGPPRILCTSRNPKYTPFPLRLDQEPVAIIGRIACKISRI